MQMNLESRHISGTMLSGIANRVRSAPASGSAYVALSALVTERASSRSGSGGAASSIGGCKIKAIAVTGSQRLEPDTVRSYIKLRAGGVYDCETLDEAVRDLMATELFADVEIRNEQGSLTLQVRENPIVNRIILEGNRHLSDDAILKALRVAPRQIFTRSKVRADVSRIVELYRHKCRFGTTVKPKMVLLEQNRIDLIYEISEGLKSRVRKIKIIGNNAFKDSRLKAKMSIREWSANSSNSMDAEDLAEAMSYDQIKLRQFYLENGYSDFKVISAVAELTKDKRDFVITYEIKETDDVNSSIIARNNKSSLYKSDGTIQSLGFFGDYILIEQRPSGAPDRVILETSSELQQEELGMSVLHSALERLILNASVQFREKGQELRSLVDLSHQTDPSEAPNSLEPESGIIATKVGVDAFLDRTSIGMQAADHSSAIANSSYMRGDFSGVDIDRLINFDYYSSFECDILSKIYLSEIVNDLQLIISAERFLLFKDTSTRKRVLAATLEASLKPVFDDVEYPDSLRANYIDRIVNEILSYDVAGREPWAARVVKDVLGKRNATDVPQTLPKTAPVLWKTDKETGDTPPDFIKRHYGQWLRADATGLTRPDIKRLDPSLYMALANWLRKNELPEDCPVPIKSERLNAELERFSIGGIGAVAEGASLEHVAREANRLSSALRRRR